MRFAYTQIKSKIPDVAMTKFRFIDFSRNLWEKLSAQERLDVLQTVVNTERRYLGIPHELNVGVANLGEHTLGHYIEGTHEIIISLMSLGKSLIYALCALFIGIVADLSNPYWALLSAYVLCLLSNWLYQESLKEE